MAEAVGLKAIVLDFDGVIVESVEIKTLAFRQLFSAYPQQVDRIVAFHEANAGVSRYEKFRVIYREILREPLDEALLKRLGAQFLELVMEAVIRCPFVNGAEAFLQQFARRYDLFLVSGTPQDELVQIVDRRTLRGYFQGVYGAPRPKIEIIHEVLNVRRWQPEHVVVIGDSLTDYRAAAALGAPFIGRVAPAAASPFAGLEGVPTVRDLEELAQGWDRVLSCRQLVAQRS